MNKSQANRTWFDKRTVIGEFVTAAARDDFFITGTINADGDWHPSATTPVEYFLKLDPRRPYGGYRRPGDEHYKRWPERPRMPGTQPKPVAEPKAAAEKPQANNVVQMTVRPVRPVRQPAAPKPEHGLTPEDYEKQREAIQRMNAECAYLTVSARIVRWVEDELGQRLAYQKPYDFKWDFHNRPVLVGYKRSGEPIIRTEAEFWLAHRERHDVKQVGFFPLDECPPRAWNLWRGFAIEPKPGKWQRIEYHLREMICDGDEANYDWLLCWYARCFQKPLLRAETCVVFQGDEGTGKNFAAGLLLRPFGSYGFETNQENHVTGNFNALIDGKLAGVMNEAFWAGDHRAEAVLKNLITDERIPIEQKKQDVRLTINRLKLMRLTNNNWAVPAGPHARRYHVLKASNKHRKDEPYFNKLFAARDAELPAFMYDLQRLDLTHFKFRYPPETAALAANKVLTFGSGSVEAFVFDCLEAKRIVGWVPSIPDDLPGRADQWPEVIKKRELIAAALRYAHDFHERNPKPGYVLARKLNELLPGCLQEKRLSVRAGGHECYVVSPLDDCVRTFKRVRGVAPSWWGKGRDGS